MKKVMKTKFLKGLMQMADQCHQLVLEHLSQTLQTKVVLQI
jgi:hypothetical protein